MKTENAPNGNKGRSISPENLVASLGDPGLLEKLYRNDRKGFKNSFEEVYPDIQNTEAAKFWKTRLDYETRTDLFRNITPLEIIKVLTVCLVTVILIKIPLIMGWPDQDSEGFYFRNAALIVFFGLTLYTAWFNRISDSKNLIVTMLAFAIPAVYINLLPSRELTDPVILSYIHLPILMWFVYGLVFTNYDLRNTENRIEFIRYNGDLAIVYALIAIAGGILTGITIGLFESIGLSIEEFYMENIVLSGAVAAPIVAAWLIRNFPALVSRTVPLLAGIFSPLVLITLIIFLITVVVTGKDPYNDREFLLVFNIMLIGVMGIIIFSVSALVKNQKFNAMVLLVLSLTAIIVDLIALSAIFYRLGDGLTPNRLAVLVSNILVLVNLILIMRNLISITFRGREFSLVETTVARFLPVYFIWVALVVFGFPLIFGLN